MKHPVLLSAFAVCSLLLPLSVRRMPAPDSRLTLAALPCTDIEATFRKFQPLVAHLKQSAGVTLRVVVPADLTHFEALLENGEVDLALQDPHTYERLSRFFDNSTLLVTVAQNGTTRQSGVVIVRRDSGVNTLAQLRGRRVLFGPRTSTSKWVAARLLFASAGLDADRDLKTINGGCCEDIAFAVAIRSVDAGIVCDHSLARHGDRQWDLGVDTDVLQVIARTQPFPTRILAARLGAPRVPLAEVAAALVRLDASVPEHARILSPAEITGFRRITRADYLRDIRLAMNGASR